MEGDQSNSEGRENGAADDRRRPEAPLHLDQPGRVPEGELVERLREANRRLEEELEEHRGEIRNLERTLDLMRTVLDGTRDAIFAKDRDGRYLMINQSGAKYIGRSRDEVLGRTDAELMPQDVARGLRQDDLSVIASGESVEFEEPVAGANREYIFESIKAPYRDPDGNIVGTIGVARDITARRQAEEERNRAVEALRESESRLRLVMDSAPALIGYVDTGLRYQFVNHEYEEWFGVPREQIEGRSVCEVMGEAKFAHVADRLKAALAGRPQNFEMPWERADGSHRDVYAQYVPHRQNGHVRGMFVVVTDLTDLKRAEVERIMLETSDAERQRFWWELHDSVCQVLAGGAMLAESLRQQLEKESSPYVPRLAQIADVMKEANREARELCHGLMPVEGDPAALMSALRKLAEDMTARHEIRCELECPAEVLVPDDHVATQLFRIAQEATHNAVKHARPDRIVISLCRNRSAISLRVADDGRGMPQGGGEPSGSGLRIMRYRAETIGGRFSLRSEAGRGTEVACELLA